MGFIAYVYPRSSFYLSGVNLTSRPVLGIALCDSTYVYLPRSSDAARAHLVEQGRLLSRAPIDNNWGALPFDRSYSDPEPGKNPWKAELMIVQCNAGLTINGHSARYTLIYFVGVSVSVSPRFINALILHTLSLQVYFEIISPDAFKVRLFKTLQTNATKLSGGGVDPSSPNLQTLRASLLPATSAKFLQDYGIPFNGNTTKPRDLLDSKTGSVRGTSALFYLPGEDTPDLQTFIGTNILA
jgi:hypothetical protein